MKDWGQLAITSEKPMFLLCILEFYDYMNEKLNNFLQETKNSEKITVDRV